MIDNVSAPTIAQARAKCKAWLENGHCIFCGAHARYAVQRKVDKQDMLVCRSCLNETRRWVDVYV